MKSKKVLIANRAEIACRIISACRKLGLKSVAVYSEADQNAKHVKEADEAVCLSSPPAKYVKGVDRTVSLDGSSAQQTYLNIKKVLQVAHKVGAWAIHPGYGFLSENAEFARAVQKAGFVWVGPQAQTIALLGNKIAAKKQAKLARVPTLEWKLLSKNFSKKAFSRKTFNQAARDIGYPLLIKAIAGGGGRGMRVVANEKELFIQLESAMREAKSSFGSSDIFLEAYLQNPRHIEVQIFGDHYGNIVTLGERECSIQRRHQKVIEEAPAINISTHVRKALCEAALRLAKSVGYENAGTVEFLLDSNENFFFLEVNTRIQVEHPVTEQAWGIDLVSLQLKIAAGEKLPKKVFNLRPRYHAVEARLYAEDPGAGFIPSPGKLTVFHIPKHANLRVDSGYRAGSEIPLYYDAMIAKCIAWGKTRAAAIQTLVQSLEHTKISGVKWNGAFLLDVLKHPDFQKACVHTQFLEQKFSEWKQQDFSSAPEVDDGNLSQKHANIVDKGTASHVILQNILASYSIVSPWHWFVDEKNKRTVTAAVAPATEKADTILPTVNENRLVAEYPGKVLKILVHPKQKVSAGEVVIICESMKMEFSYRASKEAVIKAICVKVGQVIPAGATLIEWSKP